MRHANIIISVFWGIILNLAEKNCIRAHLQPPLFHLADCCFCLLLYQSSRVNSRCFWFYIHMSRWENKAVSDCHSGSLQFFDVHSLWVSCNWNPHLSCVIKYWWKTLIINGLKYWVNYMVGLPAVEWFVSLSRKPAAEVQCNLAEVWRVPKQVCSDIIDTSSQPLCRALFDNQKGDASISVSPPLCNCSPLGHLALVYCFPFLPVFTKTLVCVTILSCKLKYALSCTLLSVFFGMALLTPSDLGILASAQCLLQEWSSKLAVSLYRAADCCEQGRCIRSQLVVKASM